MRTVRQRWQVTGGLAVWGLLLSLVTATWGHSDLDPRQSLLKKWETYTLSVPTETASPTVRVQLHVPPEFEIETIEHSRAWQITTLRDARGYVREVTWSGNTIPAQTFETFRFLARNPATAGTYRWRIEQHYEDGAPATWEAQTQIVAPAETGSQRAEEAWRMAQVATTVSLVAMGISITLIIITVIGIVQSGRRQTGGHDV
jgi:uncharacterized protein YcnI